MKQIVLIGVLIGAAAYAGPCVSGTLQDYVNLGSTGCQVGAVTFTGFLPAPGQTLATAVSPSLVQVTPGGTQYMPTLQFMLQQTVTGSQLAESFFRFNATGPQLTADMITLNSPAATGNGVVTATQDLCPGTAFTGNTPSGCGPTSKSVVAFFTPAASMMSDTATFAATGTLGSFVDLTADAGGGGSATLNSATVKITAAPEPSAIALMLTGIGAMVFLKRRRSV